MMGREWKPGDVAMVDSWRGKGQIAFRCVRSSDSPPWCVLDGIDTRGLTDKEVSNARPVVVIDPEDREQVEKILLDYLAAMHGMIPADAPIRTTGIDYLQAALRGLITDPKPDEPTGLGAVVEDAEGRQWVRFKSTEIKPWSLNGPSAERYNAQFWRDIDAVRVLAEGVTHA